MGLEQGGIPPFSKVSETASSNRSLGRLSQFEREFPRRLSRRSVITGLVGVAAGLLSAGIPSRTKAQEPSLDQAQKQEQMLNDAVTRWNTLAVKEEALGELFELTGPPVSKGFTDPSGYSQLYKTMLVSLNPQGQAFPRYVLTEMEQNNFDTSHVPPFLGDAAPLKGEFRVNPSEQITQKVAALSRVFGLDLEITGADKFAGYKSFRIGDKNGDIGGLVEDDSDGTIRMAQFALLATQAGIVPQDMLLAYEELATGGGIPAFEMRWPESNPNKAHLFSFTNLPGAKKQFNIDFNQPVPDDFVNPRTNLPFKDPKTGKDIHPNNLGEALKLLMDLYEVPEFIAKVHDISELPTIDLQGNPRTDNLQFGAIYNHRNFAIEDSNGSFSIQDAGTKGIAIKASTLFYADWWIKPTNHPIAGNQPNAIVVHVYLQDNDLPISPETETRFYGAFASSFGTTLYKFKSAEPNTYYMGDPINTPERSRLMGTLNIRLKPVTLSTT